MNTPHRATITPMLSESQRTRLWEDWLGAEIRANYFADLAGTYQRRQRVATWLALFFSSGAFFAAIAKLPQGMTWVSIAFPLVAAAASLYTVVTQTQKNAVDCSDLHFRWNKLATEFQDIWDDSEAPDVPLKLARLRERKAETSKSGTAFRYDEKRMLKWYDLVVKHHGQAA